MKEGDFVSDFSASLGSGEVFAMSECSAKYIVLYFYPKDDTPGCTIEAREFQESLLNFSALGAVIVGVSRDSTSSHLKFSKKFGFDFGLLSDVDSRVCEMFGVIGEKSMFGKKYLGILRTTFVIDGASHSVLKVWNSVKPKGHADAVLKFLQSM